MVQVLQGLNQAVTTETEKEPSALNPTPIRIQG